MNTLLLASLMTFQSGAAAPEQLLAAVRKGDAAAVRSLLDADPSLINTRDRDGVPAVRLALYYRHPDLTDIFLERGATLGLHDAAACGQLPRLRDLLKTADVNSYSTDGATALGLAAFFGHRDAVELLLAHGAAINQVATNPAFSFAPLHSAMSAGHPDIVDLLLAHGADVNVREGGGLTILHEAAALGSIPYVKLLLSRGANPAAKTGDGRLPEEFARARRHIEVAEFLARARK